MNGFTLGFDNAFVHCIVDAIILFTSDNVLNTFGCKRNIIFMRNSHRIVTRKTIHDSVFNVCICLV